MEALELLIATQDLQLKEKLLKQQNSKYSEQYKNLISYSKELDLYQKQVNEHLAILKSFAEFEEQTCKMLLKELENTKEAILELMQKISDCKNFDVLV